MTVVGPAGVGKTTMLRTAVHSMNADGRAVFGCAPSANAAAVLQRETKMPADTLDKLLYEHGTGHPEPRFQLPSATTVIVDEAGMVSTPKLAALARLADSHNWRIVLVGDPRQLSPVGRGGMFAHHTESGPVIELDRVHRFTHPWERAASLQLRRGDPDGIAAYNNHGRIHDTLTVLDARRQALAAWIEATANGEKVALLAATHDTVDWLNAAAQHHRIATGELDPRRSITNKASQLLLAGDRVVTRRNDRHLHTDRKMTVKNRAVWTVTALHPNGAITARGPDGTIVLPVGYVHDHVQLGYAETVHAAQGRTVDTSILVVDGPIDGRGVYVGLTRGRHANHAYVQATEARSAVEILADAIMRDWTDTPAIVARADLAERLGHTDPRLIGRDDLGRITDLILPPDRLRELVAERHALRHLGVDGHVHRQQQLHDEQTTDKQTLAAGHRQRHRALRTLNEAIVQRGQLGPFRRDERRELDHQIADAANELRSIGTNLERLRQQIDRRRPELDAETRWLRDHQADVDRYHQNNRRLQQDSTARAQVVADRTPPHIIRLVGPRPTAPGQAQQAWDHAAGLIEQHRVANVAGDGLTRDAAEVRIACRAAQQLNPQFVQQPVSRIAALDRNLGRSGPSLGR